MHLQCLRLVGTVACTLSVLAASISPATAADKESDEYYELMRTFVDTYEQIERNYVKDINRRQLMEAAIRGMLTELDQYSSYISPDDLARFNQQVEQEFGGIGIQVHIDPDNKRLTVMTPLPGTPAYKAGIRAGDTIMEVEGKSTKGFTLPRAVSLLKGKAGEAVTIGIRHLGSTEVEQIRIVREVVRVATVLGDRYDKDGDWEFMLDGENKIGYIRLTHFSRRSSNELRSAVNTLKKQEVKALVLDLRFNPGGLLSQATEISDMFIEQGRIVSTKGRNSRERVWDAHKADTYAGFPMAILTNRYSASASEIVSACLQDHKRAVVIGERTWGKGSVQNVIELAQGSSALKLTTASYHRPSGKNIHRFPGAKETDEWGVMPNENYKVRFTLPEMQQYLDYRRERDVLGGKESPKTEFKDRQRDKALEYLRKELGIDKNAEEKPEEKDDADKPAAAKKPDSNSARLPERLNLIQIPRRNAA